MSRRNFLRLTAGVAGGLLLGACADEENSTPATSSVKLDVGVTPTSLVDTTAPGAIDTTIATSPPREVVTTIQPDTIPPETIPEVEPLISNGELVDRKKVFDIKVTIPSQAEAFIDLPVFACMLDKDSYSDILDNKGVMLDVARKGINDDKFGNPQNIRQEQIALPGEEGAVILFAHRITPVSPDRDDNGGFDDGAEIPMFRDIDLIPPGSIMEIVLENGKSVRYIALNSSDGIGTLPGVEQSDKGMAYKVVLNTNPVSDEADYENSRKVITQDTGGRKIIRMVACHDKGSKQHRIVVEWEQKEK